MLDYMPLITDKATEFLNGGPSRRGGFCIFEPSGLDFVHFLKYHLDKFHPLEY
jgi:hypothetical protein